MIPARSFATSSNKYGYAVWPWMSQVGEDSGFCKGWGGSGGGWSSKIIMKGYNFVLHFSIYANWVSKRGGQLCPPKYAERDQGKKNWTGGEVFIFFNLKIKRERGSWKREGHRGVKSVIVNDRERVRENDSSQPISFPLLKKFSLS